ncbi:putative protein N(5)-glutamine methyltransferase [Ruania alkalisoli]|uniref:peptide chain release factor N(5)-glutamine methyltransferase n=1 Tax=Ruania alkalisoli TaxID=2779775 RepID=A0A7M1SY31_9MICO|nr:putative protein N(5)-glutamine methyltransferase [Ruania alkalisoli]QOR72459.1 putative protein N(5)-glutamine methyltransferase [Ruania alkalisoli]
MRRERRPELVRQLRAAGCVFAEEEAALLEAAASDPVQLERLVARRTAGEPLELVLGWVDFDGIRLGTAAGVFVPRARTQHLVEVAAALAPTGGVVADVCCGIGAVAAALGRRRPDLRLIACDVDPAATCAARHNLPGIDVVTGDLLEALPVTERGRLDMVVANTPYVPTDELHTMPREAREHEPALALDGGSDGLDVQRRLAVQARTWMAPGAALLTEIAADQWPAARDLFQAAGWVVRWRPSEHWGSAVVVATA